MNPSEEAIAEETQLDEVKAPGLPLEESARRAKWRAVPQRIRVAIRRLHRQFFWSLPEEGVGATKPMSTQRGFIGAMNVRTPSHAGTPTPYPCRNGVPLITL